MSQDHFHFGPNPGGKTCAVCNRELDESLYYHFLYQFLKVADCKGTIATNAKYCSKKCALSALFSEGAVITNFIDEYK